MSDSSAKSSAQNPNSSGDSDSNPAFVDALHRARQLASKIHSPESDSNSASSGVKRPLEDMNGVGEGTPEIKKMASDSYGAASQQRNGPDFVVEEYQVPDKMVGLIIGRGGEQILRLQSETGCKIQLASESKGLPERPCTLTGSRQAVEAVKSMIAGIISKANSPFPPEQSHGGPMDNSYVVEMMVPGPKVGLLIGKGGENIRNLQEKGGVKMVLIQDGPQQTSHEKPLRISGDPQKVEFAKQMVLDLLAQKDGEMPRGGGGGYSNGPGNQEEILVPRQAVGVVIGKGGDMIKRIQQDSGARVQFIQGKEDLPGDKLCQITGSMDQVPKAICMIQELIQSVMDHDQQMGGPPGGPMGMGRGRGRGRGGGPMGRPDFGGRGGGGPMGRGGPPMDGSEIQFGVPANKCGLVIGKGGETIKGINQQSGAHVEISRNTPPNAQEKVFIIRGNPGQIEHARQLIMERIGMMIPGQGGPPGGPNQGGPGQYGGQQYQQQYQQQGAPGQNYQQQNWSGGGYQAWPNQSAPSGGVPPNDPNKASADANAAAWAAYYAQMYGQGGQPQGQAGGAQTPQAQPAPAQPAQVQPQAGGAAGGQADYSAAWVEYYRSLGMYREAELIEQQSGQSTPGQPAAVAPAAQAPAAAGGAQPAAPGGYPGGYAAAGQQPAAYAQPAAAAGGPYAGYGYNYAASYAAPQ